MLINTYSSFYDLDNQLLTINDAYYTLNTVRYPIPGSFFSFDASSKMILVDPTPTSQIGNYTIEVKYTDGNLVSNYETFNVEVTDTKPWFHNQIPYVIRSLYSSPYSISLSSYYSDPNRETLTMSA